MFSKSCEYGIRATLYIAQCSLNDERSSLKDISKEIDSPESFTAKILQQLTRAKIIDSMKGPTGGFSINDRGLEETNLRDIVTAIDGEKIFKECGLGLKQCDASSPCPVHHKFKKVRENLIIMLEGSKLKDMAKRLDDGEVCLKIA